MSNEQYKRMQEQLRERLGNIERREQERIDRQIEALNASNKYQQNCFASSEQEKLSNLKSAHLEIENEKLRQNILLENTYKAKTAQEKRDLEEKIRRNKENEAL